jgi:hypothetical protein
MRQGIGPGHLSPRWSEVEEWHGQINHVIMIIYDNYMTIMSHKPESHMLAPSMGMLKQRWT